MIPDLMQAIEISAPGGAEVLRPVNRPVPVAGHGQILIRVAWAGVNLAIRVLSSSNTKAIRPPTTCRPWKPVASPTTCWS